MKLTQTKESVQSRRRCAYDGEILSKQVEEVALEDKVLKVCDRDCQVKLQKYLAKERKYKVPLFLLLFVAALAILVSAIFDQGMFYIYFFEVAVGLAFIIWPYPISAANTYFNTHITKIVFAIRIVGIAIALIGVAMILFVH
jgi:hypothetical protein